MKRPPWAVPAFVALSLPLAAPLYNPDLYWHLSAGRRILETRAIPTSDWLSSTRAGTPWVDFEWLAQTLYAAVYGSGGYPGLWLLKGVLFSALALLVWRAIRLHAPDGPFAWAALTVWAAAVLPFADLRPDTFSALGFAAVFLALERERLGRGRIRAWLFAPVFALWANLHAGWPYGVALIATHAFFAASRREGRAARLAGAAVAAVAGACLQPGGPSSFSVLAAHGRDLSILSQRIMEWRALDAGNPWHRLLLLALAAVFVAAIAYARRARPAAEPVALAVGLAAATWRHARLGLFFPLAALAPAAGWAREAFGVRGTRVAAAAACGLALALAAPLALSVGAFRQTMRPTGAEGAIAFLQKHQKTLGGRAVYGHAWQWGGELGWVLYPRYKTYADGRYIFHDLIETTRRAATTPENWTAFLDKEKLDLVILQREGPRLPTRRRLRDGSFKDFTRPYYAVFMPKERWALTHWDERALLFVRRSSAPARWLDATEFRVHKPDDEAAFEDALARGEIDRKRLATERRRL